MGHNWLSAKLAGLVLIAGLAVVVAACGGDDKPTNDATPAAAATSRPGTAAPGGTQVRAGLSDLNSYKCTLKLEGQGGPLTEVESMFSTTGTTSGGQTVSFEASVTYVKPDKSQVTIKLGEETIGQTTIGRQQWSTLGSLTIGPNAVLPQTPTDLSVCASFWDEGFASGAAAFQCSGGRESVNGSQTRKCSIDRATFDQVRGFFGGTFADAESGIKDLSRFQLELWVTEGTSSLAGGLPVRLRVDMAGKDTSNRDFFLKMEMDVTNLNDGGLNVTPPR